MSISTLDRLLAVVVNDPAAPRWALRDALEEASRWTWPDVLRLVLAHRDSDGVRLLAADLLDEHAADVQALGCDHRPETADRAEFIHVQVELVRCELCKGTGRLNTHLHRREHWPRLTECPSCLTLRRRAHDLLLEHAQTWLPASFPPGVPWGGWCPEFRRGFVAAVTLSAEVWLGGVCGRCGGNRWVDQEDEREQERGRVSMTCPACQGTGRSVGHAIALLAACPLEEVWLTTWPRTEYDDDLRVCRARLVGCEQWHSVSIDRMPTLSELLAAEWPGLRFTLPVREVVEETYLGQDTDLRYGE
jgi:uncharacterized protein (TIGR02996 family)